MEKLSKKNLLDQLKNCGQHNLANLAETFEEDSLKTMIAQVSHFNQNYPGGLRFYCQKGRDLVSKQSNFEEMEISMPQNLDYVEWNEQYENLEASVASRLSEVAFVLVAGGLGERLGFPGIKLSISCEFGTGKTFLELYLEYLKAFSVLSKNQKVNLLIMTSASNHEMTLDFIERLQIQQRFAKHVTISFVTQALPMPCFKDIECNLDHIVDQHGQLVLTGKPHGHGDIHLLVKQSGILEKWKTQGVRSVCFFQDTNPFSLPTTAALYGYMTLKNLKFLFSGIRRVPGEAVGVLVQNDKGSVFNVEYNIFDQIMQKKSGDVSDNFVGNINNFMIEIDEYQKILSKENGGVVAEFVNIKKCSKTGKVSKTFRLECLMQDIALEVEGASGVLEMDRMLSFTTCKNSLETGQTAQAKGKSSATILECEADLYMRNCRLLEYLGCSFGMDLSKCKKLVNGIEVYNGPRIVIDPMLCCTVGSLRSRLSPAKLASTESTNYKKDVTSLVVVRPEDFKDVQTVSGVLLISDEGRVLCTGCKY